MTNNELTHEQLDAIIASGQRDKAEREAAEAAHKADIERRVNELGAVYVFRLLLADEESAGKHRTQRPSAANAHYLRTTGVTAGWVNGLALALGLTAFERADLWQYLREQAEEVGYVEAWQYVRVHKLVIPADLR
jgi:hypothetical protein